MHYYLWVMFIYFVQLFVPFEYTKAAIYTVENVGGGIG